MKHLIEYDNYQTKQTFREDCCLTSLMGKVSPMCACLRQEITPHQDPSLAYYALTLISRNNSTYKWKVLKDQQRMTAFNWTLQNT